MESSDNLCIAKYYQLLVLTTNFKRTVVAVYIQYVYGVFIEENLEQNHTAGSMMVRNHVI